MRGIMRGGAAWLRVECPRCGVLCAEEGLRCSPDGLRLSSALRRRYDETGEAPSLSTERVVSMLQLAVPPSGLDGRVDQLLLSVEALSPHLGERSPVESAHAWAARAWLPHPEALHAVVSHERYAGLFDYLPSMGGALSLGLTVDGLVRLELLGKNARNPVAFMAYAYRDDVRARFLLGGTRGLCRTGFVPYSMEGEHTTHQITDRMVGMIRRCRLFVADLTHASPNVLWEAGFADGLGRSVVYTRWKGDSEDVPFDVSNYQQIRYADGADLEQQLVERLVALGWALTVPEPHATEPERD